MQLSLTPAILDLAARSGEYAVRMTAVSEHANVLADDISRLGRDQSGSTTLPADDPRVVAIRGELSSVADEADAAIAGSRFPETWESVSPYAEVPGRIRSTVRRMERSAVVNVDGLARTFGRSRGELGLVNAQYMAESVTGAVSMLTRSDGTIREVDASGIDAMVAELEAVRTAWGTIDARLADTYRATQRLVDDRNPGDHRDDVLYVAELVDTVRPSLERTAAAMRQVVPQALKTVAEQSQAGGLAEALAGTVELLVERIDHAASEGRHSLNAEDFLFGIERLRGDSRDGASLSPSTAANREAWDLRVTKQYAETLPA